MTNQFNSILSRLNHVKQLSDGSHQAQCPSHKDKLPSLSITEDGDKILMHCHAGCTIHDIIAAIGLTINDLFIEQNRKSIVMEKYNYTDAEGSLKYQVVKYENKGFSQRKPDDNGGWVNSLKGVQRMPYRLPEVIAGVSDGKIIIIAEGEKDVNNLVKNGFKHSTTNSGGAGKWDKENNQYFKGANVVIIPDNDDPGRSHAQDIASKLHKIAKKIRVIALPGISDKQDISNWLEINDTQKLKDLIKKTPTWKQGAPSKPMPEGKKYEIKDDLFEKAPFQCLGVDHSNYYYLSKESKQIIKLSSNNHTSANLISLARLQFWEKYFKLEESSNISWRTAQDALYRKCNNVGIFNPNRIRGCGAWYDDSRTVLHLGNRLRVDGKNMAIDKLDTRYIYEAQHSIEIKDNDPLPKSEAMKFREITEMLSWDKPISAYLFAGWCVIAPICGALLWRPHIWLTGSAGTGKSWIINYIVHKALGNISLFVQSNTTEAGIRQTLGNNAFPLVFDEAESENQNSQFRLQKIIDLMRQASSENSAGIIKGTQGGQATTYRIRSCFMLASVNVTIEQQADTSRVSILGLKKNIFNRRNTQFDKINSKVSEILTREYCAGLRARTISMIPVIRKNADVFSRSAAEVLGEQRAGDQLGALLAGAYSLYSDSTISYEDALKWIKSHEWDADKSNGEKDEIRCLHHILQNVVSVEVDGRRYDRTMGNLIANVSNNLDDPENGDKHVQKEYAESFLKRNGMRVKDDVLWISDSHREMKRLFRETSWHSGWKNMLLRIDGAEGTTGVRFEPGTSTRAVGIPLIQRMVSTIYSVSRIVLIKKEWYSPGRTFRHSFFMLQPLKLNLKILYSIVK